MCSTNGDKLAAKRQRWVEAGGVDRVWGMQGDPSATDEVDPQASYDPPGSPDTLQDPWIPPVPDSFPPGAVLASDLAVFLASNPDFVAPSEGE